MFAKRNGNIDIQLSGTVGKRRTVGVLTSRYRNSSLALHTHSCFCIKGLQKHFEGSIGYAHESAVWKTNVTHVPSCLSPQQISFTLYLGWQCLPIMLALGASVCQIVCLP